MYKIILSSVIILSSLFSTSSFSQAKQSGDWQYVKGMAASTKFYASAVCAGPIHLMFDFKDPIDESALFFAKIDEKPIMGFAGVNQNSSKGGVARVYLDRDKAISLLANMVKGSNLTMTTKSKAGSEIKATVSLIGFTKAYKSACSFVSGWDVYTTAD